jgi:palmitoyltransferase
MNKFIKEIPFIQKVLKKNGFIIFFLTCFLLDYIFCVSIFYRCFEKDLNKKSFKFFSHLLYYYTMIIYLFLLFKNPSQTNISKIISDNHERIISEKLLKKYNKKCLFCGEKNNQILKFERTSHCSQCNMCILRRDHHCVFTNKCVGYKNLQLFINFNIWLMIFGIHYYIGFINYYKNEISLKIFFIIRILINILGIITTIVFVFVFKLVLSQVVYGINNITYYESINNVFIEKYYIICNKSDYSEDCINEYNNGWLFNWKAFIGPTIFHIFFPLPINYKYDFDECDRTFKKIERYKDRRIIKKLSGKIFDSLDNIIQQEYDKSNPVVFMENVRQIYKNYEII